MTRPLAGAARGASFALLAALAGIAAPSASFAICPSGGGSGGPQPAPPTYSTPGGGVTPGLRAPSDPVPPPPPPTTQPGGTVPPPPEQPPGPTTPRPVSGPPPSPGPVPAPTTPTTPEEERRRPRGGRGAETLDDRTWETWWAWCGAGLLPVIGGRDEKTDDGYARGRDPNLEVAVDALIEGLRDPDEYVRTGAARAVSGIDPVYRRADLHRALVKALADPYREVREVAGLALAFRGAPEAVVPMRRALVDRAGHEVTRGFAALSLVRLGDDEGIRKALDLAQDAREPDLAGAIWVGLGATKDRRWLRSLIEAAERRAEGPAPSARRVRCDAIVALGKLGDPLAVDCLARLLEDRERVIARAAALALGGFRGDARAFAALRKYGVTSSEPFVRAFSAVSMGRIGLEEAVPSLGFLATREGESVTVRTFACLGLGLLGGTTPCAIVERVLASPGRRDGLFAAAAIAAGLLRAKGAEEPLARALGGGDPWIEGYASTALGLLGASGRVEAMRLRLWPDDARVNFGVVTGLGHLDAEGTGEWLGKQLRAMPAFHRRLPLVDALSLVGAGPEATDIAAATRAAPGHRDLRVRAFYGMARILAGHRPSWATKTLAHTYYLNNNAVLWHLTVFP